MNIKERRKALGWSRADLAARSGVNSAAIALIERDQWSEEDALTRVVYILGEAEKGNTTIILPPPEQPKD